MNWASMAQMGGVLWTRGGAMVWCPLWSGMNHYRYQADLFRLHLKHRVRPSRYEDEEIHPLADNVYEGEPPDCYKHGTWPALQSKRFRKGRSLAK